MVPERHCRWSIWRVGPRDGTVEWYTGMNGYAPGWSSDWGDRERIGGRSAAMSKLWELRHRGEGTITLVRISSRIKGK